MTEKKPDLKAAYAVETQADALSLYADWATTYDEGFAKESAYQLPAHVARLFLEKRQNERVVLDVGCGTGLVALCLHACDGLDLDGLDLSPEMLEIAGQKQLYSDLICADLMKRLPIEDGHYDAVLSAGTFTHGHVGPEALDELLRVARPGALFVLSVNALHFEKRGFAAKFDELAPHLHDLALVTVPIYGDNNDSDHGQDKGHIAIFHKA